jgi:hypothetical protein
VEESSRLADGSGVYRLIDGQTVEVDYGRTSTLLGGEPLVGELLLAGMDPDGRQWVAGIEIGAPGRPSGCFWLPSQGRLVGGWIDTTAGFRLTKAAKFDPGSSVGGEFASDRGGFCLNDAGEVTGYGSL